MKNIEYIKNEIREKGIEKIVKFDESLKNYTSLKIGGPADIYCFPNNIEELKMIIYISQKYNLPFYIIGNGTNLLILDKGISGIVVKLNKGFQKTIFSDKMVKVGAGISLIYLSKLMVAKELSGLEFACNIPGTLGGAIISNASFKANSIAGVVQSVTFLTKENKLETVSKSELGFNYRECNLKRKSVIILEATLQLKKGNKEKIKSRMRENIKIREDKQPLHKLSAGSIFKNPPGYYAGELIEKSGAKGLIKGEAEVSSKNANFIINKGNANARDILYLIKEIEKRVKEKFRIKLEHEIEILGER